MSSKIDIERLACECRLGIDRGHEELEDNENTLEALLNHWKELWLNAIVCNVIKGRFTSDEFELEFSGSSRAEL